MMARATDLPGIYNITVYRGDAYQRPIRIQYRDDDGTTKVLDTDGWTGRMGVKATKSDEDHLLHSDNGDITITTGIQGSGDETYCIEIFISAAKTAELDGGMIGVYDLELTDTAGRPLTYLAGPFCVEGDVS